ncbi:MAG TPA: phage baseplate assembly protein V [Verrucomicrobiae bacterium]|jgi:uncharacterized protein involved in type VI secretion and phage assembly
MMRATAQFEFPPDLLRGCHLAQVTSVQDPDSLARVKVKLLTLDGDGEAEIWARVAVPFAGADRGALFIPDVGDEVFVAFVAADPRFPIVLGGLWNGGAQPPEQPGGDRVNRWSITGKAGTRIAIVEESSGSAKIEFKTPNGVSGTLTDESGGSITFEDTAGNSIKIDSQGISLQAASKVSVQAGQVSISAGMVSVDAGMSKFSGVVKCDVLQATSVVASTYTPGAGNVW